mgnify:CR=1 FL=1
MRGPLPVYVEDPVARLHIINLLSRFPKPEVQRALQQQLKDTNKLVRSATLAALAVAT